MFFKEVTDILEKASNLNEDIAWLLSIDNGVKKKIVEFNTIDQLRDKGIDALNDTLGDYSEVSVEVFGKREGHITLEQDGDFYHSFRVTVQKDSFNINANSIKQGPKGTIDLTTRFGDEIIGLTDENRDKVTELILINTIKYVRKQLLNE